MEFKKTLSTATLLLASTFVLAACGGADTDTEAESSEMASSEVMVESSSEATSEAMGELQDGTYTLVEKNFDTRGWKTEFSITVVDGMITESTFENVNEAGEKKSEDAAYQENMVAKAGVGPADYFPQLNAQLVEKQDPAAVEVVTGATSSYDTFKEYAPMLVEAAQAGDTTTIEIDNVVEE
ncbi:major membrane immunogen (membrane-anchored lipoprotein) [Trichococcus patagoniensis]|uniref:Major membrane immunogen (Membrane-anchored lipoprotein) n=1 Tax=Trichococcus patagoniensis TaxID=382641 RepID=A0A2T5IJG5_9LACT|nr:FMN-binding protein [Trichococcus patagoniensis]PTQ83931.1 major membrane immunogen (membrane-anchored lipoprotein) [Trichococcus patagoniensis]